MIKVRKLIKYSVGYFMQRFGSMQTKQKPKIRIKLKLANLNWKHQTKYLLTNFTHKSQVNYEINNLFQ